MVILRTVQKQIDRNGKKNSCIANGTEVSLKITPLFLFDLVNIVNFGFGVIVSMH